MPRNLNGAGSIRKKTVKGKNGKDYIFYEARVTVDYDPTTGKQKQKSISGKTKTEVRKRMTELNRWIPRLFIGGEGGIRIGDPEC